MQRTLTVYHTLNYVTLLLSLIFSSFFIDANLGSHIFGITFALISLVIGQHYLRLYRFTFIAAGLLLLALYVPLHDYSIFSYPALTVYTILIFTRPPATFLYGIYYSYWGVFLITAMMSWLQTGAWETLQGQDSVNLHHWLWLHLLIGYVISILPYYINRESSPEDSKTFHTISSLIVYLLTFPLQLFVSIIHGVINHCKNYVQVIKQTKQFQANIPLDHHEEPAVEIYWMKKSFTNWNLYVQLTNEKNRQTNESLRQLARSTYFIYQFPLGALPTSYLYVVSFFTVSVGYLLLIIKAIIHLLLITIIFIPFFVYFLIFYIYDSYYLRTRKISTICPTCYTYSTLPYYLCHHCERIHKNLRPGRFGIRKRTCACGAILPTTALDQRYKLQAICTNDACQTAFLANELTPITISLIGGPSSGKTSFILSAIHEFMTKNQPTNALTANFLQAKDEAIFNEHIEQLKRGIYPSQTSEKNPQALNVQLIDENEQQKQLLYIFDPAGDVYQTSDELLPHQFLKYTDGYVLLIDPFTSVHMAQSYEHKYKQHLASLQPAKTLPENDYNTFIVHLSTNHSVKVEKKIKTPLAVVISKIDGFKEDEFFKTVQQIQKTNETLDEYQLMNKASKKFLQRLGYRSLVRQIETRFTTYQFFIASSNLMSKHSIGKNSRILSWLIEQQ